METEGSLPCLQEPVTCSHLERDQSTPCHHNDFLKIHFNVTLLSTSGSSKWFFSIRLSARTLHPSLFFPLLDVLRPSHCPWFDHSKSIQNREAFYGVVFSSFLLLSPSDPNVTLSILSSSTLTLYISFSLRAQGILFRTECFAVYVHPSAWSYSISIKDSCASGGQLVSCMSCSPGYTGCNRRNGPDFGRVFLMLNYTEKPPNTYIQSWTVWKIMASEVWNFDSCYTLTDYQIRIETGRNMWFL